MIGDTTAGALTRLLRQRWVEQSDTDREAEGTALEELAMALAGGHDSAAGDDAEKQRLQDLFRALVNDRLLASEYTLPPGSSSSTGAAPPGCVLRILQCTRLLLRDRWFIKELVALEGAVDALAGKYKLYAARHFSPTAGAADDAAATTTTAEEEFHVEILSELASIFKKLASDPDRSLCPWRLLAKCEVHQTAVSLLSTRDSSLLASVLVTLCAQAAASEECAALIARLDCVDQLLLMLREYDALFKQLAADLLQLLCRLRDARREVHRLGGVTTVVSLLNVQDGAVLEASLRVMAGLLSEGAAAAEMRAVGGVPILVSMLVGAGGAAGGAGGAGGGGDAGAGGGAVVSPAVTCLVCSALTKLAIDDEGGIQIRQCNGVYLLGRLLTDSHGAAAAAAAPGADTESGGVTAGAGAGVGGAERGVGGGGGGEPLPFGEVQAHAFRAMRFVFSVERNRKVFKRLFPPSLFAAFIDVGHYKQDVKVYRALAQKWRALPRESVSGTEAALEDINQGSGVKPTRVIRGYVVTELLGSGAFGSVYRVHKERCAETVCAMKELNPSEHKDRFGATPEEVSLSVGRVASEVEILSRLEHPNIVNYYESFTHDNGQLYIIMELVEGASLLDFITSAAEKGRRVSEESVWDIFLQVVLALHYIHVEKGVVHRDLTPNNILLEHDTRRVKIADFGLAKDQGDGGGGAGGRRNAAVMQSAVGTMPYSCPEIIMHAAYNAKADVWSLGCVLYHMLALRAPFDCSNPLMMASAIVEGRFPSLEPLTKRKSNGGAGGGGGAGAGGAGVAMHGGGGVEGDAAGGVGGDGSGEGGADAEAGRGARREGGRDGRREILYSSAIVGLVSRLLTTDPARRPSISEVAAACSPYLMRSLDRLQSRELGGRWKDLREDDSGSNGGAMDVLRD